MRSLFEATRCIFPRIKQHFIISAKIVDLPTPVAPAIEICVPSAFVGIGISAIVICGSLSLVMDAKAR